MSVLFGGLGGGTGRGLGSIRHTPSPLGRLGTQLEGGALMKRRAGLTARLLARGMRHAFSRPSVPLPEVTTERAAHAGLGR
jgi:hypothetical protein